MSVHQYYTTSILPQHKDWKLTLIGNVEDLALVADMLYPRIGIAQPEIFTKTEEDELCIFLDYNVEVEKEVNKLKSRFEANHVTWQFARLREGEQWPDTG